MSKKIFFLLLSICLTSIAIAQERTITGTVNDDVGSLPGVTIVVKGTTTGTTTDFDGKYSITIPNDEAVLVYSFIGFATVEEVVGSRTTIDLTMGESAETLSEVVVTALGFTVDKKTLGATYSKVGADELATSGETSVINSLQGKASGVRIARANGDPGAGSNIQIRGANTIFGSTQPLIILDGVPISNDNINGSNDEDGGTSQQSRLNDINEDDIETINILKGASAAAIWGSAAANGVIVITTKRGKGTGKINVEYKTTLSLDKLADMHPLQETYGQGRGGVYGNSSSRSASWGDKIADRSGGEDEYYTKEEEGYFVTPDGKEILLIKNKNSRETFVQKNLDQAFQDGFSNKHNLSFSAANEKGSYRFSFGHINQEGIIKTSDYKKTNIGISGKYRFNEKFDVNTKIRYAKTSSNRIQQSSNTAGLLLGLLRNAPDFDISDYVGDYFNEDGQLFKDRQRSYRNHIGASSNPGYNNALWTLNRQKSPSEVSRIILSSELNYKTTDWLSLKFRGSYDTYTDERRYFFPVHTAGRTSGQFRLDNIDNNIFNLDIIARTKTFNLTDKIHANFLLGYNFNDKDRKSVYDRGSNFIQNSLLQTFANASEIEPTRNLIRRIRSFRVFYTGSFDYQNQFFVNTSLALEQASSIKGAFLYPSIDASWVFTESAGLKDNSIINVGKIRAGVGQVGVQPIPHRFQTTYEIPTYSDYDDPLDLIDFGGGYRSNDDLGNANLKPEIKTEYEIGTDLTLFDYRLTLGATYYYNKIVDVLIDIPESPSVGVNNIYGNGGSLQNKGLELDFNYNFLKDDKGLNASIYGNFNNNQNEVLDIKGSTSLPLTSGSISSRAVAGHQLGVLWGTKALRNADGSFALDANGFPQLDPEQGIIGDPNPDWRGGLGMRLNFKGVFANVLVETSQGGAFAERTRFILGNFGTHADVGNEVIPTTEIVDRAGNTYPAGVPVRGNIRDFGAGPVLLNESYYTTIGGGFGSSVINEFAINQDASWTRLSEVTLGYTLKSKKFQATTKLSSITFTLTGRNLALWTDILGIDPQTNQTGVGNGFGIDYFTNPASKTYLFTLKIKY